MLLIGKADKYFTLWDVSSTNHYGQDMSGNSYLSYVSTWFDYKQNLSMTESKAIEKAKGFGVTDLVPNEDLRGKHRSWKKIERFPEPKIENVFTFGKFRGDLFVEKDERDIQYMKWYYDQENFVSNDSKIVLRNRIVELNPEEFCIYNDELETVEFKEKMESVDSKNEFISTNGFVDVFVDRNVDSEHILYVDGIWFVFPAVKQNWYNGYPYYLPVFDGKAKRIKNKNVRIHIKRKATDAEPFDWEVSGFEIIKK